MSKKFFFCSLFLFSLGITVSALSANEVTDANNRFAFELYAKYKTEQGNIFFSPFSISSALAMTYEGAKGKTAEEMQAVFHFPKDNFLRRESFLEIYKRLNKPDKKYELGTANALWAQKNYLFLNDYFALVEKYYGGKVTNLDFVNQAEPSRLTINSWVENRTSNKIKNLIPPGMINEMTRLILTNAIYFKGRWVKQFKPEDTKERGFKISPDNLVKARMMELIDEEIKFNYSETEKLQVLELPYAGDELSMLVLLPKEGEMHSLEVALNEKSLDLWRSSLKKEKVEVYLPKFKFESKYFMADTLKEMGMPDAFSENADFSGMTGKKDLFIGEVIHQGFVEVNEEGTEAAAATAVIMLMKGPPQPSAAKIFNADHPFIFIIQEKASGNILFLGRVNDPTV
ncbi:MAG: serpin family protein [Candidatus Omnitrophota bacterium]